MKLLVVEDENKTADYVRQGLMEAGFVVDLAQQRIDTTTWPWARHTIWWSWMSCCRMSMAGASCALRDAGKQVPVLFLTARGGVDDRVKGLELGADDYLVKPFAFSELLARVRTLLRRGSAPSQPDHPGCRFGAGLARRARALANASISPARSSRCLSPRRGGPSTVSDRVAGMGHEFRQQRHRCSHPPSTREDERCVQSEAHPHRAWNGIHARCAR